MKVKQFNKRKKIKITKENRNEFNFKEVALTKMAKRQLLITLFSILGVTIISLGSAYAVFTSVSKSADYNVIKVGTLNIDFGDSTSTINLNGNYPMTDEEGLQLAPYKFTITNTGTLTADYEVFIQDDTNMISEDNCEGNQLNKDYIRYQLDNGTPANLSSIAGSNYRIARGTLAPEESVTYTLYVWIREGVGNDVLNKHYHGKIVVNGINEQEDTAVETLLAKVNAEDLDYNSATDEQKKEMWTFSHPATEQTEALTDYRYIGADPNNYVTFNNETWRIIGVFTVDDGTGNKEQRLKLIRDESIGNIAWDSNSTNDWPNATLNANLNSGDYWTNSLSEEARNMIGDSLWYLGGTSSYTSDSNGTASHFYTYERGTTVYSGRDTSWLGKVGLMYQSDYGYATSGGTTTDRNTCLNTALYSWYNGSYDDCRNNDWLFNSAEQWTINPNSSNYGFVFALNRNGSTQSHDAFRTGYGVRPAVFLKSSIKIDNGDGSSSNPYILAS